VKSRTKQMLGTALPRRLRFVALGQTEMTMKPKMTTVIAERRIRATVPGAQAATITIQIGRPARDPNPKGDWYCPITMKGFGRSKTRAFFGIDPLQALQFALGILDLEVRAFAGTARLSWLEQPDSGLKPWIPEQKAKEAPTTKSTVRLRRP
jgi:hypothetical protein